MGPGGGVVMTALFTPAAIADARVAATVLLAAFAMSHLLALVYVWTHRGLSYSQSYVQTLVMSSVVTALMMLTIGTNLVFGIGMVGAMALVRFRTNLRDPRDMVFVFAALVCGIATGTRAYGLGAVGWWRFRWWLCTWPMCRLGRRRVSTDYCATRRRGRAGRWRRLVRRCSGTAGSLCWRRCARCGKGRRVNMFTMCGSGKMNRGGCWRGNWRG